MSTIYQDNTSTIILVTERGGGMMNENMKAKKAVLKIKMIKTIAKAYKQSSVAGVRWNMLGCKSGGACQCNKRTA